MNTISDAELKEWSKWGEGDKQPELKDLLEMLVKLNGQRIDALLGIKQQLLSEKFSQLMKKGQQSG